MLSNNYFALSQTRQRSVYTGMFYFWQHISVCLSLSYKHIHIRHQQQQQLYIITKLTQLNTLCCLCVSENCCISTNRVVPWWPYGHIAVHSCPVHRGTVGTVEETYNWALTVTSRSLWTTSSQPWCRLFPLHWQRGPSKVDRQVLRTWRPMSPTETLSWLVWRSSVTTGCRNLKTTHC